MSAQRWEVVGGGDKGGILVRSDQSTSSSQLPERLATGTIVEERELVGDRLQYQKVSGAGPDTGWVSVTLKDKALLVRCTRPPAGSIPDVAETEPPVSMGSRLGATREGDYYVTLGVLFKKPGFDPETQKIIKLNRRIGAVVHTTGKTWRSPSGGFWVELDTSVGDTGAGEKPGYVMIDAGGFGTPGPCLQMAVIGEGPPWLMKAMKPADAKAWDSADGEKEFLAFPKTAGGDIKVILAMLFGLKKEGIVIFAPSGNRVADNVPLQQAGFQDGMTIRFEGSAVKPMTLRVMSPVEEGVELCTLPIKDDWTVAQVKTLLCKTTGLQKPKMIMARGRMGERVGEGAHLNDTHLVVDCGYKDGDEIAFIYLDDPAADLEAYLVSK